ncbi:MAG: EpsG family protein [Pseudomonadota bacterium]
MFGIVLTLLIGFRFQVGGDWTTYLSKLRQTSFLSISDVLFAGDPGYSLTNWLANQLGFFDTVWPVNLTCGMLFSIGLLKFCARQPLPWLAVLVSIPYLVVVVAMGYSRQGVAIGLAMLALLCIQDRKFYSFMIWMGLAALFHKTAVLLMPIGIIASTQNRYWTIFAGGLAVGLMYLLFLSESVDGFLRSYVQAQYQSEGAAIRIAMNAIPSALFLFFRKRFLLTEAERRLWTYMCLIGVSFIALLIISPSSTAVDRMALYFIPIQIFVWSRLPFVFGSTLKTFRATQLAVVGYSAAIMFVWLNFAGHAYAWVPFKLYGFADPI